MKRTGRILCLLCLVAAALWRQPSAPAEARARSTNTAQDTVGKLELTVFAEVTGHYSSESRQRGAGSKPTTIDQHIDDKMSVTLAGTTEWPITSRDGFDEALFPIDPGTLTTAVDGHGHFNKTETHGELCDVGLNSPRQERWYTNNQDMTWAARTALPAAGTVNPASVADHVVVTRDTADPDHGMYILGVAIPTGTPTLTGQETNTYRGCDETRTTGDSLTDNPIGDGGALTVVTDTVNQAMQDAAFTAELKGTFDRHAKGFSVTRHALFRYAPTDDVLDQGEEGRDNGWVRSREHHDGFLNLTYTLTYHVESDVDAVIEPEAGYDDWMPEAPSGTYEPRPLEIHVRVHKKGDPGARASEPARFRFELVKTSQEPGYCLNAPKRPDPDFTPTPADEPFDLEIGAKDNPALKTSHKGQRAETKDGLADATVLINPADWGGYTKLKVTAILKDGTEIVAHLAKDAAKRELRVPIDDNDNHIADGWEKPLGLFARNLAADWNESDDPSGQLDKGDGISLYEKYRGFEFDGRHESLQPSKKYLFLFDEDDLYKEVFSQPQTAGLDFASLTKLEVRLIAEREWTGTGAGSEGHRIVNFNHRTGHAAEQHALHLKVSGPLPDGMFGLTWPDGPDVFGPPRVALRSDVDTSRVLKSVTKQVDKVCCTLPRPPGPLQQTFPNPYVRVQTATCDSDTIADAYRADHIDEMKEAFLKMIAYVVSHELAHAVGVQHHEAREDGDRQCVMRYFKEKECAVDAADPVELKCRSPWPAKLASPDANSHAGMGCFQQITVNDAK